MPQVDTVRFLWLMLSPFSWEIRRRKRITLSYVVHGFSGTHDHHIGYPLSCNGLDPINLIQHF